MFEKRTGIAEYFYDLEIINKSSESTEQKISIDEKILKTLSRK